MVETGLNMVEKLKIFDKFIFNPTNSQILTLIIVFLGTIVLLLMQLH